MATGRQHRFIDPSSLRSPTQAIAPQQVQPPLEKIDPPLPPRRDRPFTNFLSGFLSLVVILSLISVGIFFYVEQQIQSPGPLPDDHVTIVRGGSTDVIDQLERDGVIDKPFLLALYWQFTGKASQIKAGEYLFKKEASLSDVTQTLIEGKSLLHPVTIPEGRTSQQVVDILLQEDSLVGDVPNMPKEGSLLPETYKVARGMTRVQLLDRMAQEYARLVKDIWAHRAPDLPLSTPQEMVILASVVEKETARADERPRIAAVFINRLQRGMKLQSDPTIIYGLVGGKGSLGRSITRADIESVTPYNTYVVPALPVGPICNPGRAALEAVANPSKTKELYFVADGTGGHVFAETLDQHQKNVQRWRQIEAGDATPSTAAVTPAPSVNSAPAANSVPAPVTLPGSAPANVPNAASIVPVPALPTATNANGLPNAAPKAPLAVGTAPPKSETTTPLVPVKPAVAVDPKAKDNNAAAVAAPKSDAKAKSAAPAKPVVPKTKPKKSTPVEDEAPAAAEPDAAAAE